MAFEATAATASGIKAAMNALGKDKTTICGWAGDGGTFDIGLQSLSGALERGHNFTYLCWDNEAYMNTGIQRSSSTPFGAMTTTSPPGKQSFGQSTWKKDMVAIAVAHGIPYVATASPGYLFDLYFKVKKVFNNVDPLALINKWRSLTERIIELLRTDTCAWVVANPEHLAIEQAFNIADSFDDFGIEVKGFILNKVLPAEICQDHPFWQAKFIAQQKCREKMYHKANIRPLKEIPELIGNIQIDGFLQEVAGLLHQNR
jgi:hypothetical protein